MRLIIRYDTKEEFNVDSKAEYSALSSTRSQKKKLKQTNASANLVQYNSECQRHTQTSLSHPLYIRRMLLVFAPMASPAVLSLRYAARVSLSVE